MTYDNLLLLHGDLVCIKDNQIRTNQISISFVCLTIQNEKIYVKNFILYWRNVTTIGNFIIDDLIILFLDY